MKAWRLHRPGGKFALEEIATPEPKAGAVVVRMEAAPVLSYMRRVVDGSLGYALPNGPFTPGTNGIGTIAAVGSQVYHLKPGQRVALNPHHAVDERTPEPAQILIGLTAMGSTRFSGLEAATLALQADWPDGVLAEFAHLPAACATPIDAPVPPARLAAVGKFVVPYGGFLRGGLAAGDTVIVNGATGYFGAAAVVLAIAMGAARVVAAGRDQAILQKLAATCGGRVAPARLSGDIDADAVMLRDVSGGGADLALDIVGRATSADSTLATLRGLRRGGRLVLMGSMSVPLPLTVGEMLGNNWSVIGQFMYPKDATARLAAMISAGTLDLGAIDLTTFALADLDDAMDAAARMRGLDLTVVTM
jgi:alcohol dehydrogenase